MQYIDNLLEKRNMSQLMLVILFIIYLVMGLKMPDQIANIIDSPAGKIVVALIALLLFGYSNPILGVLGIMVAYQLIKSSSEKTGMAALEKYYPTEEKKWSPFTAIHQFPYTLEQEVVKEMASQKFNANYVKAPYRPMLDDTHDASMLS
jgi:hypothetical protein